MATVSASITQHGLDDFVPPDMCGADREVARQEWLEAIKAWEDGLTEVEPPSWKEFWG